MSLKFTVGHLVERIRYRELMEIITCSSPPLECIAMSYTRGLTCYQSLKYYFVHLHWLLCELYPCFHLYELWRDDQMLSVFKGNIPCLNWENHSKVCIHPWHDHQKPFWPIFAFLKQETKLDISALYHKSGITNLWIEFNTYSFRDLLRSSAEGNGCKTD